MKLPRSRCVLSLAVVSGVLCGCRGPQALSLASTSITVPADWHVYLPDEQGAMTSLHLQRSGIPLLEKDSIASFYVSTNTDTNTVHGAEMWQQRTAQSTVGNFVSHTTERVSGHYISLCVTGANASGMEVLDCVVEGAPLMFSFAGSSDAEEEARGMLRSLR